MKTQIQNTHPVHEELEQIRAVGVWGPNVRRSLSWLASALWELLDEHRMIMFERYQRLSIGSRAYCECHYEMTSLGEHSVYMGAHRLVILAMLKGANTPDVWRM